MRKSSCAAPRKRARIVGEVPCALYLAPGVYVVVHGARPAVEEHALFPGVYLYGLVEVGLPALAPAETGLAIEAVEACGYQGCRTVGACVLGLLRVRLPRYAPIPWGLVLGSPCGPYPVVIHLPGLGDIHALARGLEHAYPGQHYPLHVVHKDVPPRVAGVHVRGKVEPWRTLPPQWEKSPVVLAARAHIGIH